MKKILLITGIYPPDIGGPSIFVKELFSFIKRKKDKVKVITLKNKGNKYIDEENIIKITRSQNKLLRTVNLIYKIRYHSKDIDSILCCGLMLETYIALIGLNKKRIYRFVGDSIRDKYRHNEDLSDFILNKSIFIGILTFFRDKILSSFDLIITPSEYLKKYIRGNIYSKDIKVISNFSSFKKYSNNLFKNTNENKKESKKIELISISRLVKWKNIDYLIEAFRYLKDFNLHIYGEGPEEKFYNYLINKYELDNVFMYGFQNREEIIKGLSDCDAFIQISRYEGMSFSILESLSLNKPMILSNIEPNFETAKSAAIYVNPYSIKQLKSAIKLLKCNSIKKAISENANKIYSEFYDKDKSLQEYYNEL
tara:strand:- start:21691 stop:22791 length:1101 start_codon:yes stop_codon:yes gene_type:complete